MLQNNVVVKKCCTQCIKAMRFHVQPISGKIRACFLLRQAAQYYCCGACKYINAKHGSCALMSGRHCLMVDVVLVVVCVGAEPLCARNLRRRRIASHPMRDFLPPGSVSVCATMSTPQPARRVYYVCPRLARIGTSFSSIDNFHGARSSCVRHTGDAS